MNEVAKHDFKQMHLTSADVKVLLCVYGFLTLVGSASTIAGLVVHDNDAQIERMALVYCLAMSMAGAGIFYTRKLYKSLINSSYTFLENGKSISNLDLRMKRIGTLTYFFLRPAFGIVFALVMFSLWKISLSASGADLKTATSGFLYSGITLGFVSGFLAGRLIGVLEGYGNKKLASLAGGEE